MKRYYLVQDFRNEDGTNNAVVNGVGCDGEIAPPESINYNGKNVYRQVWIESKEKAYEYAEKLNKREEPVKIPEVEYSKEEAKEIIEHYKSAGETTLFDGKLDGAVFEWNLSRERYSEGDAAVIMAALVMAGVKFVFKE